ncbi:MAG: phosphoenolpyruvate--protein phosphotransferase [Caldithrix sp.]|nr:phosphoenolpyruvate--protein phosphotransferase [Caldithrix sp.]
MPKNKQFNKTVKLSGIATSPGIAIGPAFLFRPLSINIAELESNVSDVEYEIKHFEDAISKVSNQISFAHHNSQQKFQDQFADIFESQQAFLKDPVLINEIKQKIKEEKHSAALAVSVILAEKSEHFINLENTYFRERAYDIIDLKQKLINALLGIDIDYQLSKPSIVVADMLSPSDTVNFNRNFILGFLTDKGGSNSHAAILARGLRIPSVVNGYNLSKFIQPDQLIIVDGFQGEIIINPDEKTKEKYLNIQVEFIDFENKLLSEIDKEAVTADGHNIRLSANIEFSHEVNDVKVNHADGVGLFRTESLFIEKQKEPSEEDQFEVYKKILEQLNPQPVVIRTLDLGGDKILEGYSSDNEMNPFLGWRAIRFCLDRPGIFKTQLRAILKASVYGKAQILIPMISSIEEIMGVRKIFDEVKKELRDTGVSFDNNVPIGVMIETPAAAMVIEHHAKYADFFSIGTNDLTQYVLAIDRTNDKVSKYYNTFNPAVLYFIEYSIKTAKQSNKEITLCGEFAAVPQAIPILLGMGLRHFSMNPFYLPEAKKIIRSIKVEECVNLLDEIRPLDTGQAIQERCNKFIKKHVPDLKYLM